MRYRWFLWVVRTAWENGGLASDGEIHHWALLVSFYTTSDLLQYELQRLGSQKSLSFARAFVIFSLCHLTPVAIPAPLTLGHEARSCFIWFDAAYRPCTHAHAMIDNSLGNTRTRHVSYRKSFTQKLTCQVGTTFLIIVAWGRCTHCEQRTKREQFSRLDVSWSPSIQSRTSLSCTTA